MSVPPDCAQVCGMSSLLKKWLKLGFETAGSLVGSPVQNAPYSMLKLGFETYDTVDEHSSISWPHFTPGIFYPCAPV